MKQQVFQIWPELQDYESKTHYIYGAAESTRSFVKRPILPIVDEIRTAIREHGKSKFIFLGHEEALLIESITKIHRILNILGDEVKPHNLFFTTSSINGQQAYENFCNRTGYHGKRITILSCHGFERNMHTGIKGIFEETDVEPSSTKEKLFLCFNKVNREHRMRLVDKLLEADLVKDAFYSFQGEEGWMEQLLHSNEFVNIQKNIGMFPLKLNITPDRTNPVDVIPGDIKYHKNSYFSVVTETIFFDNDTKSQWHKANVEASIFFTEKTFKCFALKHPFILLGRPHCLPELHKAGYKTFSPYIDESYDAIEDNDERFNAVVNEIKRLCSFSQAEWDIWSTNIKDIVDYNHKHFYNRKGKGYNATPITEYFKDVADCNLGKIEYLSDSKPDDMVVENLNVDKNWNMLTRELSGNIQITFPIHLDGGGFMMKDELVQAIGTDRIYNKCYEWCSGFGVLGYEIFGKGIAKNLVFSDYYGAAVRNCIDTAIANNIADKVIGYVTPAVKHLPEHEKFDLVVSNPPHSFSKQAYMEYTDPNIHTYIENSARLLVDDNFGIHREFFKNIRKNLTHDADLYIIESNIPYDLIQIIKQNGFTIVNALPISFNAPHSKILHIKIAV